MKDMIAIAERGRKNKGQLAIKNIKKTAMVEVANMLSTIDLKNKQGQAISNADIDIEGNLGFIGIEKS